MKPNIIRWWDTRIIEGYVGVVCRCGNTLHVKKIPERAGEFIKIECPCGCEIQTIYTIR